MDVFEKHWEEEWKEKAILIVGTGDPEILKKVKELARQEYERGVRDGRREQLEKN